MAEILLEGRDCEACGTEVRKGALFCYHCGASVAPYVVVTTDTREENGSDAALLEDTAEDAAVDENVTVDSETVVETAEAEVAEADAEEAEFAADEIVEDDETETAADEKEIEDEAQDEPEDKPKLKSAAAMRRQPKRVQKKRVEIVWDEPVSPPNVWFLIATILFAALAVGLWFVAKYLG